MTRQKTKNPSPTTTRQVVLRPAPVNRRDPLLSTLPPPSPEGAHHARLAEVAGASFAECVAIWCCCPCAIADFFLLAVYRVPAGLCRRALRKRRRRRLTRQVAFTSKRGVRSGKKGALGRNGEGDDGEGADPENARPAVITLEELLEMRAAAAAAGGMEEGAEMEVEMWRRFSNMGFWRSPSCGEEEEEECNAMQNLTLQKF